MIETAITPAAALADHAPGLERFFAATPAEGASPVAQIEGDLPAWLRGTYYVNGPARFERGGQRYRHWLDGDGMVACLRFPGGGAGAALTLTRRFVRSHKLVAEESAGRPLFRTFGTAFPGDQLVRGVGLASPVNVSVLPFAGELLACGEQGRPWRLHPETLETLGEYDFGGSLGPLAPFSAHAKVDPSSGELFNFGISYAADHPRLNLYRFAADGRQLYRRHLPLPYPASVHDFALSPSYAVFHVAPYLLDMPALAERGATVQEALSWRPDLGSILLIAARDDGRHVATVPLAPGYCLHTANAWEQDGRLAVDLVELERPVYDQYLPLPDLFADVGPGGPVRLLLDPARGRLLARTALPYRLAPDFPALDPRRHGRPYRDLWLLGISAAGRPGRKFFDQLVHCDWDQPDAPDIHQEPPGTYLAGEPAFIPAPDSDCAGLILCQRFDARRNAGALLLFDAQHVAAGPRAILHLDAPLPAGFHAVFVPASG
jgi:all-trans-8'-apo-beta-carotenal 15,15'-oxygenase